MRRAALLLLILLPACGRAPARESQKSEPDKALAAPDTLPQRFVRNLAGTAGDERVELWLRREGDVLTGAWVVGNEELWLSGTVDASGVVSAPIHSDEGDSIGSLHGTLAAGPEGIALSGRLLTADGEIAVTLVEERVMLAPAVRLVPHSWLEEDAEYGWSLHAEVPAAEAADGRPLAPQYAAFNTVIDSLVRASAAPFQAAVLEDVQAAIDEGRAPEGVPSSWESSYEVALAKAGIVSILFDVSDYYSGAAHPNHTTWAVTWDFDASRAVPLDALFRPGAPYLQALSDYVIPELERKLGPDVDAAWIEEGAGPVPDNFASWSLTREGIRIVFDPYQVAPYAAGPSEVLVRWSAIEPLVDPAGPLARIAR